MRTLSCRLPPRLSICIFINNLYCMYKREILPALNNYYNNTRIHYFNDINYTSGGIKYAL